MKPYFYFSRSERRYLCILAVVILILLTGGWYLENRKNDKTITTSSNNEDVEKFLQAVKATEHDYGNHYKTAADSKAGKDRHAHTSHRWNPHPFNPNTCDSSMLIDMGLSPSQVHGFLQYRRAGARFYNKKDLERVFVFSSGDIDRMIPYASFPEDPYEKQRLVNQKRKRTQDSLRQVWLSLHPAKMKDGEKIDINQADTSGFQTIPGIGSHYSRKIIAYRERLGGFIHLSQISEIEGLPEDIDKWLSIQTVPIRKINLNRMDFKTLLRHPYLNYQQVKVIFMHRSKYGPLSSLQQLSTEEAFTEVDLERLAPYVEFK